MKALAAAFLMIFAGSADAAIAEKPRQDVPALSAGKVEVWKDLDGGAAGKMRVWVWLPPGYGLVKGRRHPVLYMHDGQNLFDKAMAGYGKAWDMDEAIARMAGRNDLRHWIVVGIESPDDRLATLFPEALFNDLPPAFRARVQELFKKSGEDPALKGAAYQHFVARVVKPQVDRRFATRPGQRDTAVMGSSFGGLASLAAIAAYPDVYGAAAALSVTASLSFPVEKGAAEEQAVKESAAAFDALFKRSALRPGSHRIYFDHGTGTDDGTLEPYVKGLADVLDRRGWKRGMTYDYRTFAGAAHDEIAWAQRAEIPLGFIDSEDP